MSVVKKFRAAVLALAVIALLPSSAAAETYSFSACLTNNFSGLCGSLSQFEVEVTDAGGGLVDFTFTNDATVASSMTDIYFDADGFLVPNSLTVFDQSAGVNFSQGASPLSPPGASAADPDFVVTTGLHTDSNAPVNSNGINSATEFLTLRFTMTAGTDFDDIIAALDLGPDVGNGIRIAAHVQGIGTTGNSEVIICCDNNGGSSGGGGSTVPEPTSMALFGLAALGAAARVRRRAR